MAGGIDWFRWHHGSVTDPKFQLVAKRSGASLPDVLAVWAYLLEGASAATERGHIGGIDCEAVDCLFGFADGLTEAILAQMVARELIGGDAITSWEKRQPKREREDDNAAERKRRQRETGAAIQNNVTPCHATSHQETPREEKRREEIKEKRVARGSRMPADWTPDAEGEKFAATFGLGRSEIEKFRDYWSAQPGQKGVKLDWPATWRNWCRNAQQARASPYAKPDPSVTVPSRADEKSKAWIEAHASTEEQTPEQREATAQRLRETRQKLRAA